MSHPFVEGFQFVFALALMLGVLITAHEFGHFIVAKLCGVRVLKFSIGFGPAIGFGKFRLAWNRGGTDYVVAWIPLGGYVKMLGEVPGEEESPEAVADREHTLGAQKLWKKLAIVSAGPAMNLLLPVFVLWATLFVGVHRANNVVGTVEAGSPAAAAGIQAGDRITSVNGQPVRWWDDLDRLIRHDPGSTLTLGVERGGHSFQRELAVAKRPGLDIFRERKQVGWIGLQHSRQKAILGIDSVTEPAARAGLRSGDRVVAVDGKAVADWNAFAEAYAVHHGGTVSLRVERGSAGAEKKETVTVPALGSTRALGVIPAVVLVKAVNKGMPAGKAGIEPGDVIVAVNGSPIGSFFTFQETVLASGGQPLEIQVAREGRSRVFTVRPQHVPAGTDGLEVDAYLIGIQGVNAILPGSEALDQVRNPIYAVPRAVGMTYDITRIFLVGLHKIISGQISRSNIGGPIEIARQSQLALAAGWDQFLNLLMLISINLGILNLLPIPILDGGQAVVFLVEGAKRGPLSLRTREIVQQVGLILLVALMGFAFWNDITRHWSSFLEWMKGL